MKIQKAQLYFKRALPTLLAILSAGGVVGTAVLAVKETPKALAKIEKDKENSDKYTKIDAVKSAWKYYIPAATVSTLTIACILGSNILNKRKQMALSGAYMLINKTYQDYKNKVKELYGEKAHQDILNSIAVEKSQTVYLTAQGGLGENSSLDFDDEDDICLFYDTFSEEYFQSTKTKVLEAEYHLNRNFALGCTVPIGMFYEFLGLKPKSYGDVLGWTMDDGILWIDFNHQKVVMDDGLECYIIEMIFTPHPFET